VEAEPGAVERVRTADVVATLSLCALPEGPEPPRSRDVRQGTPEEGERRHGGREEQSDDVVGLFMELAAELHDDQRAGRPAAGQPSGRGAWCVMGARFGQAPVPAELARLTRRFTEPARISEPNKYERNAWRSTVLRSSLVSTCVSETWNVMPMVNARYAKSA
jgi:hypothetical protein